MTKNDNRELEAFIDTNQKCSIEDGRSNTGYYTYIWGNPLTWRSKKQNVVARSSAEAKFRVVA